MACQLMCVYYNILILDGVSLKDYLVNVPKNVVVKFMNSLSQCKGVTVSQCNGVTV